MGVFAQIGLVAVGSALGGLTRWVFGLAIGRWLDTAAFPYHTLFINVTGSLFLGWFLTTLERHGPGAWLSRDDLQLLLAVGFTGAYTTFSTFEFESYRLLRDTTFVGALYIGLSVTLGLLAVRAGMALAR